MRDKASVVTSGFIALGMSLLTMPAHGTTVDFLPSPYVRELDSPFLFDNGGPFSSGASNFFLENFEDQLLNTPGVTASSNISFLSGPPFTDSVDEDDGSVDGNGISGTSLLSSGSDLVFTFDQGDLGNFPTHVGLVVTGLNGNRTMEFRAFDPLNSLASSFQFDVIFQPNGGVSEDRFIGISSWDGISRVELAHISHPGDQVETDHLQYGISKTSEAIPTPALLPGLVGFGLSVFRKNKKAAQES